MAVKKTIAVIGACTEKGIFLSKKMAAAPVRLLLISEQPEKLRGLEQELRKTYPGTEVLTEPCAFEGCWEADIIILATAPEQVQELAERIRDVSTQKTVILVAGIDEHATVSLNQLQQWLPYSRIAGFMVDPDSQAIDLAGDEEAIHTAKEIFKGYKINHKQKQTIKP